MRHVPLAATRPFRTAPAAIIRLAGLAASAPVRWWTVPITVPSSSGFAGLAAATPASLTIPGSSYAAAPVRLAGLATSSSPTVGLHASIPTRRRWTIPTIGRWTIIPTARTSLPMLRGVLPARYIRHSLGRIRRGAFVRALEMLGRSRIRRAVPPSHTWWRRHHRLGAGGRWSHSVLGWHHPRRRRRHPVRIHSGRRRGPILIIFIGLRRRSLQSTSVVSTVVLWFEFFIFVHFELLLQMTPPLRMARRRMVVVYSHFRLARCLAVDWSYRAECSDCIEQDHGIDAFFRGAISRRRTPSSAHRMHMFFHPPLQLYDALSTSCELQL